jgi:hypothetical protein
MNYLLRYHLRLGDIVRCLPIAKKLHDEGHNVVFGCLPEYHGIFDLVDFCGPVAPANQFFADKTLDLQIWPKRYDDYRASRKTWGEYVYGLYPESAGVCEQDVFGILSNVPAIEWPDDTALVCGWGYSQPKQPDLSWLLGTLEKLTDFKKYVLLPHPYVVNTWQAQTLAQLAGAIKAAPLFCTIDSAPNALAAAVGRKSWYYLPSPRDQDNFRHPNQIVLDWD